MGQCHRGARLTVSVERPRRQLQRDHDVTPSAGGVSGHEGLGYWSSPFLFFGMSVTTDGAKEQAALEMGCRLNAVLAHARTGINALTFLLPEHTPAGRHE